MEYYLKILMKILEMKNKISQIKNSEGMINKLDKVGKKKKE